MTAPTSLRTSVRNSIHTRRASRQSQLMPTSCLAPTRTSYLAASAMSTAQRETPGEPDRTAVLVTCCEARPASSCRARTPKMGRSASHMTRTFRSGKRCRNWCVRSFNLVHLNTGQLLCMEPRWKSRGAGSWSAVGQRAVRRKRHLLLPSKARVSYRTNGRFLTEARGCTPFRSPSVYVTGCSAIYPVCALTSEPHNASAWVSRVQYAAHYLCSPDGRRASERRSSHSWTAPSHWRAGSRCASQRWQQSTGRHGTPAAHRH
jgi:hypothetical protein